MHWCFKCANIMHAAHRHMVPSVEKNVDLKSDPVGKNLAENAFIFHRLISSYSLKKFDAPDEILVSSIIVAIYIKPPIRSSRYGSLRGSTRRGHR